jgi:hypothetical protein
LKLQTLSKPTTSSVASLRSNCSTCHFKIAWKMKTPKIGQVGQSQRSHSPDFQFCTNCCIHLIRQSSFLSSTSWFAAPRKISGPLAS